MQERHFSKLFSWHENMLLFNISHTLPRFQAIVSCTLEENSITFCTNSAGLKKIFFVGFSLQSLRMMYYIEHDWFNDEELAQEFLEYSEERHPWETVEDRIISVRYWP